MELKITIQENVLQSIDALMSEWIYTGCDDEQRLKTVSEYVQWCMDNFWETNGDINLPDLEESIRFWLYEEKDLDTDPLDQ